MQLEANRIPSSTQPPSTLWLWMLASKNAQPEREEMGMTVKVFSTRKRVCRENGKRFLTLSMEFCSQAVRNHFVVFTLRNREIIIDNFYFRYLT